MKQIFFLSKKKITEREREKKESLAKKRVNLECNTSMTLWLFILTRTIITRMTLMAKVEITRVRPIDVSRERERERKRERERERGKEEREKNLEDAGGKRMLLFFLSFLISQGEQNRTNFESTPSLTCVAVCVRT